LIATTCGFYGTTPDAIKTEWPTIAAELAHEGRKLLKGKQGLVKSFDRKHALKDGSKSAGTPRVLPSSVQRWKKESPRLKAGTYPSDGSRVTVQLVDQTHAA
jgi:hypothetical protein